MGEPVPTGSGVGLESLKLLVQLCTAALGAFLALLFNRHLDNRKAEREYATKLSESVRDDVKDAMVVASEYWAGKLKPERKISLEATMRVLQAEITLGAKLLDDHSKEEEIARLDRLVRQFLKALTGGTFEAASVPVDKQQILLITTAGSRLRSELAKTRRGQLTK
jgi:hypothetical protein